MNNSLLLRSLKQLSAKERKGFGEYLRCGLFNRRDSVTALADHLLARIARPEGTALQPEALFAAAFPERRDYDYAALRHTMSYLLEALRNYLALLEFQQDPENRQQTTVRAFRRRGMDLLFDQSLEKASAHNDKAGARDARYHYRQYQLLQEKMEYTALHERSTGLNPGALPDQLTTYYVAEMLRHACTALMYQAVVGQEQQIKLLDAILGVVHEQAMLDTPAVAVYYHAYRMLRMPEENEAFFTLKQLLQTHEQRFSAGELRSLYLIAINGCIRRMNAGQRDFIREAFEVYKTALERQFLLENGFISTFTYKNVIRLGSALGEDEWTARFAEQYRAALPPRERENAYLYNRAFLYFQQSDYARAMVLLRQISLEDPLNDLHARRMLVRSYMELGEYQALESLLQSFGSLLRRKKNLGYHRDLNLRFVHFVQRLMKLPARDADARAALREAISAEKEVAEREWLLGRLSAP